MKNRRELSDTFVERLRREYQLENLLIDEDYTFAFEGWNTPVRVLGHHTRGARIYCVDFGDEFIVLQNGYVASFINNIARVLLYCNSHGTSGGAGIEELAGALAKKFVAEQILEEGDCAVGRVLFLETIIEYDHRVRLALTDTSFELRRRSNLVTAAASDLLLYHELGHVLEQRDVGEYQQCMGAARALVDGPLVREVAADLFAVDTVYDRYKSTAPSDEVISHVCLAIDLCTRLHVLYLQAADIYVRNEGGDGSVDLDKELDAWLLRRDIMLGHIHQLTGNDASKFDFWSLEELQLIANSDFLIGSQSERARALAQLISSGFERNSSFKTIVDSTKHLWVLERP